MNLPEVELMVGQMIVTDLRGLTLPEELGRMAAAGLVSGFLMFPGNDATPAQVRELTDDIRNISGEFPVILAIDQEGGRVSRLQAGFTEIPAMRGLGATRDERLAFEVGAVLGSELAAAGINVDFAPVADLDLNPENQVIGDRALSADPEVASRLCAALVRGLHSEKILACAKHFPGHGASREDSHQELPMVDADPETVRGRELAPFKAAMKAGADMVMVGHILYPALDKYHPATLSEKIITGLLREELGFQGVVVTDALEMKALEGIALEDRAFMAARAGADIILLSEGIDNARRVHMALCQAVITGALPVEKVCRSFERVTALKQKLLKQSDLPPESEVDRIAGSQANLKIAKSF